MHMNTAQLQQEILRLKKEKDVCVLAHSYQAREICEIADYTGDSYKLSVDATKVPNRTILMCGVRFMAETCKLLSPEKTVLLAQPLAGCDMADQMDREMIEKVKADYPGYTVVAYVNTTAQLKTICDVCVTSSSAVQIVNRIENKNILFIPDCNLGSYVAQQCPDKNIKLLNGGCPIHASVTAEEAGIIQHAKASDRKEFIIGTEISIAEHLQYECPDKTFRFLSMKLICPHMKATTLPDVYNCLTGKGGEEIVLSDETVTAARRCIDEMIRLGG